MSLYVNEKKATSAPERQKDNERSRIMDTIMVVTACVLRIAKMQVVTPQGIFPITE
jgi:hypothetical protein